MIMRRFARLSVILSSLFIFTLFLASGGAYAQDDAPPPPPDGVNPIPPPPEDDVRAGSVPTPFAPAGTIYTCKPTYKWSAVSGASKYQFQVYKGTTKVIDKVVTGTSSKPAVTLAYAAHKWRVRAYVSGAWKAWSAYKNFTVKFYIKRVSVSSDGIQANNWSNEPSISADGRYIAFYSRASNLVGNDNNNKTDIFVHDRQKTKTVRVSLNSSGGQANDISCGPSISANGVYIAFFSNASNLVTGDTNGESDVFVSKR